jgi:ketosteroid isomerase-like protein
MSTWGGADVAGENIEIVKRIYAALGEKDRPAILALLAPDIVIRQSPVVPWGGEYHGHEGALQFFGKLAGTVATAVEAENLFEAGDQVVQVGRTRGHVVATGKEFDIAEAHVWTIHDGKAARAEFYIDTPAQLAALSA